MKILAVDDDWMILELLEQAMSVSGQHELTTVTSGEKAIELLERGEQRFDCFLLDIQMPNIDGVELCRVIREMPMYKRAPILMATAMSQKAYIDRAFAAGASDYVTKPFDFEELETRLTTAARMERHRARGTTNNSSVVAFKEILNRALRHSLSEPFEIQGVKRAVGFMSFENYVLTLPIANLFTASVFAVKISKIKEVYKELKPIEFHELITDVAKAISTATEEAGSIFSYRGNGMFMCFVTSSRGVEFEKIEAAVQREIASLRLARSVSSGATKVLNVVVGEPATMRIFNRATPLKKATSYVEKRSKELEDFGIAIAKASEPLENMDEDLSARRQSYETILQDFLGEGSADLRSRVAH